MVVCYKQLKWEKEIYSVTRVAIASASGTCWMGKSGEAKGKKETKKKRKKKPEEKEHISLSHLGSRSRARSFRLKEKNRKCPKGRTRRRRRNLKKKYSWRNNASKRKNIGKSNSNQLSLMELSTGNNLYDFCVYMPRVNHFKRGCEKRKKWRLIPSVDPRWSSPITCNFYFFFAQLSFSKPI